MSKDQTTPDYNSWPNINGRPFANLYSSPPNPPSFFIATLLISLIPLKPNPYQRNNSTRQA